MKRFAILMCLSPDTGTVAQHAVETIEAALDRHHAVFVFLYQDGVAFGRCDRDVPQGEPDLADRFQRLTSHPNFEAVACITAAERRGLRSEQLAEGIRFAGLGEWTEQLALSDRVVQFQ